MIHSYPCGKYDACLSNAPGFSLPRKRIIAAKDRTRQCCHAAVMRLSRAQPLSAVKAYCPEDQKRIESDPLPFVAPQTKAFSTMAIPDLLIAAQMQYLDGDLPASSFGSASLRSAQPAASRWASKGSIRARSPLRVRPLVSSGCSSDRITPGRPFWANSCASTPSGAHIVAARLMQLHAVHAHQSQPTWPSPHHDAYGISNAMHHQDAQLLAPTLSPLKSSESHSFSLV